MYKYIQDEIILCKCKEDRYKLTHTHADMHTHAWIHACTHTHTRTHTQTHTHTHTYTHTHKHALYKWQLCSTHQSKSTCTSSAYTSNTHTHPVSIPLGKLQTSTWMFRAVGPRQCSAAQENIYQAIHKHLLNHSTFKPSGCLTTSTQLTIPM